MKKIIMLLCLSFMGLQAGSYIGVGMGTGDSTYRSELISQNDGSVTKQDDVEIDYSLIDIKWGYIFESNNRFEITYTMLDGSWTDSNGTGEDRSGLNLDWVFTFGKEDNMIVPFITLGVGFHEYNKGTSSGGNGKVGSTVTNYGVGILYSLAKSLEAEVAYKFKSIDWKETTVGQTIYDVDGEEKATFITVGIKYKF